MKTNGPMLRKNEKSGTGKWGLISGYGFFLVFRNERGFFSSCFSGFFRVGFVLEENCVYELVSNRIIRCSKILWVRAENL